MKNKNLTKMENPEIEVMMFENINKITTSEIETTGDGSSSSGPDCLAKGTKITMADGSIKNIEDIVEGDIVMTFSHELGILTDSKVLYAYKGESQKCSFTLCFSNEVRLSIVGEHDLFEKESNKYVTITEESAEEFIGKHFYNVNEKSYIELTSVIRDTQKVEYYELYTENNFNTIANGMLNVADDVDYLLNIYEFSKNLKADTDILKSDINEFGIFDFSEKYGFDKKEYNIWNMRYLNLAVGKGLISWNDLINQRIEYNNQRNNKSICECA